MAEKAGLSKTDLPPGLGSPALGFIGFAAGVLLFLAGVYFSDIISGTINTGSITMGAPLAIGGIITVLFFSLGFMTVPEHGMGSLTRKMFGKKMKQGQIIARSFDEIGIQANTLVAGFYWFNPIIWKHEVLDETKVDNNQIGLVTAIDGNALEAGRLLGNQVACNNFQDALAFLENGTRGPQIGHLPPGRWRINTKVFQVELVEAQKIKDGQLGEIVAKDGKVLPSNLIIAPEPKIPEGKTIQDLFLDPQAFIDAGGFRGPQLATLQPGEYYINTLFFKVIIEDQGEIAPGYVGVVISNVGEELENQLGGPSPIVGEPGLEQPVHEEGEAVLQTDMKKRGIIKQPVATGKYNLNKLAYKVIPVPTSAVTIDWGVEQKSRETEILDGGRSSRAAAEKRTSGEVGDFFKFGQLKVTSQDGFQLLVDVRLIIRISAERASFIIARFGTVENLIQQIAHPLIDASFRNNAGAKEALKFVQERTALQDDALTQAIEEFKKYHIEVQKLLILFIDVDKELLETQTKKQIAALQIDQFKKEAGAQTAKAGLEEQKSRAEKQKALIDAELGITIAENDAKAAVKKAEGARDARIAEAEGEAQYLEKTGTAKGAEVRAIYTAKAEGYEEQVAVLGPSAVVAINTIEKLSENGMKIVPDITVSGENGGAEQGFMAVLMEVFRKGGGINGSPVLAEEAELKEAAKKAVAARRDAKIEADKKAAEKIEDDKKAADEKPAVEVSKPEIGKATGKLEEKGTGKGESKDTCKDSGKETKKRT